MEFPGGKTTLHAGTGSYLRLRDRAQGGFVRGQAVPKRIDTGTTLITKQSAAQYAK